MLADKLNHQQGGRHGLSRFVALVHTEGCGAAPGYSQQLYLQTVRGHISHPLVAKTLLIEHGCEQTHNDAMRGYLDGQGLDLDRLGWASVQLDGGIKSVMDKGAAWFAANGDDNPPARQAAGLDSLRLGLTGGRVDDDQAAALALLARWVVSAGGLVVLPENAELWRSTAFRQELLAVPLMPTLGYGETAAQHGLQVMETPTDHGVETLTGLAASGVEVMLNVTATPLPAHPLVPLLQVGLPGAEQFGDDLDLRFDKQPTDAAATELLAKTLSVLSGDYTPKLLASGGTDFQLTRGLLGLSLITPNPGPLLGDTGRIRPAAIFYRRGTFEPALNPPV